MYYKKIRLVNWTSSKLKILPFDFTKKMKSQVTDYDKMLAKYTYNKELIGRIYNYVMPFNKKIIHNKSHKAKDLKKYLT